MIDCEYCGTRHDENADCILALQANEKVLNDIRTALGLSEHDTHEMVRDEIGRLRERLSRARELLDNPDQSSWKSVGDQLRDVLEPAAPCPEPDCTLNEGHGGDCYKPGRVAECGEIAVYSGRVLVSYGRRIRQPSGKTEYLRPDRLR